MKLLTWVVLVLIVSLGSWQKPINDPATIASTGTTQEPTYYEIQNHFYTISQITWAVAIREGSITPAGAWGRSNIHHQVCGIKTGRVYASFPTLSGGLADCSRRLGNYLARTDYKTALSYWKTGHLDQSEATKKYISDISQIIFTNAYSYK